MLKTRILSFPSLWVVSGTRRQIFTHSSAAQSPFRAFVCTLLIGFLLSGPRMMLGCDQSEEFIEKEIGSYIDAQMCTVTNWMSFTELWDKSTGTLTDLDYREWTTRDCPSPPPGNNDGGGDGTDPGGDGCNPFQPYDGNVMRKVSDLAVEGSADGSFGWTRHHNTDAREGLAYFGVAGSWRHSWQFDLLEDKVAGQTRPDMVLIYPSGMRRVFNFTSPGTWAAPDRFSEKIATTADGFEVTTGDRQVLHFVHSASVGRDSAYDLQSLRRASGLITTLEYDKRGFLIKVLEPAGRSFVVTYADLPFQRGVSELIGKITQTPATGQIVELAVPVGLQNKVFRNLRVRGGKGTNLSMNAVTFTGSENVSLRTGDNLCTLDLGTSGKILGSSVQIQAQSGTEAALVDAVVEGMTTVPASKHVVSSVQGSDGSSVAYHYTPLSEPAAGREFISLTSVSYGDGTEAKYTYQWGVEGVRPQLVECDDPRYEGRAKQIRYAYQKGLFGTIHHEINPVTGGIYASLEFDPKDPDKRTVTYSDLRQVVYKMPKTTFGRKTEGTDSLGRTTRYEFDGGGAGRMKAKVESNGTRHEIDFDTEGRRVRLRKIDGQSKSEVVEIGNTWTPKGHLSKVQDQNGRTQSFERDERGRIMRAVKTDGTAHQFTYDEMGRVTSIARPDGKLFGVSYNARGLKETVTDSTGKTIRYEYDSRDRQIGIVDALGRTTRREVNDRGLTTKMIHPDGTTQSFAYDKYGRKISETDVQGRSTSFVYDELARIVQTKDFAGRATTFDYTELPQGCGSCTLVPLPSTVTGPDGRMTKNLYDTEGRLLARTDAAGTPAQATATYTYDERNNIIAAADPLGRMTRYTYDENNRRLSVSDPLGRTTLWAYDGQGNIANVTGPDGGVTNYKYDANGRVTALQNAAGDITRYTYDDLGNIIQMIDPTRNKYRYTYSGRLRTSMLYPDGRTQTWEYDLASRVTKTISPDGVETRSTYDTGNRVLSQIVAVPESSTNPSQSITTTNTYDGLGHRLSATDGLGRTTRWTYDAMGNILSTMRPDGAVATNTFDAQGHLLTATDVSGNVTLYAYNLVGDVTALRDANGHTYQFTYDGQRRKTAMIYPDGSKELWTYDLAGELTIFTNRSGQTKAIAYNAGGQPLVEKWTGSSISTAPSIVPNPTVYTYDVAARVQTIDNAQAKLTYTYDGAGRLASETSDLRVLVSGLAAQTVGYRYDELGRRAKVIYPDGSNVTYAYDALGRVATIDSGGGGPLPLGTYSYTPLGAIRSLSRENGVQTRYQYDLAGQLTDILHSTVDQTLASSNYNIDLLGRRTSQSREDQVVEAYAHDATSQLVGVDYGGGRKESFAYDPVGNRTKSTTTSGSLSYATNPLNEYSSVGGVAFAYDTNGNLTFDGRQAYAYDAQNRLVSVEGTSVKAQFFYDAKNRCVLRQYYTKGTQGQWSFNSLDSLALTYDTSWNLLIERTLDGTQVADYKFGTRTDEILLSKSHNKMLYPLVDGLGSTVALTENQGNITDRFRYDAFGQPHAYTAEFHSAALGSTDYHFLFTGREWLREFNLNDCRNRYYLPSIGRWTTIDPLRLQTGINVIVYVSNSPISYTDPFGLLAGDPYSSLNAAACAALKEYNTASVITNSEFSGAILSNIDGTFTYTAHQNSTDASTPYTGLAPGDLPRLVADFHTHGDYTDSKGRPTTKSCDKLNSDNFSQDDIDGTTRMKNNMRRWYGLQSYQEFIGTPSGEFKSYDGTGPGGFGILQCY